jgi:sugar phosphate isomerase/epimerase
VGFSTEITMRFGIMAMQWDYLIPGNLDADRAIAHVMAFDHAELVRSLAVPPFKTVELGGDMALFLPHTFQPPGIQKLAALKDEMGLTYTVHLPLWSVEPSTPLTPVREGSVQALVECIHVTLPLEPENYVLHATGELAAEFTRIRFPDLAREYLMRQFQSGARQSIQAILQQTGIASRRLALETIEFPFDLTFELAEELDLSMCLDTGHILVGFSGPITLEEALERCLPRLAEVHFHDGPWQGPERSIGYGKDHQPLGAGDLPVADFLDALDAADFTGPLIFELRMPEAQQSLDVIRRVRPRLLPGE